jgi:hypothetical protein
LSNDSRKKEVLDKSKKRTEYSSASQRVKLKAGAGKVYASYQLQNDGAIIAYFPFHHQQYILIFSSVV